VPVETVAVTAVPLAPVKPGVVPVETVAVMAVPVVPVVLLTVSLLTASLARVEPAVVTIARVEPAVVTIAPEAPAVVPAALAEPMLVQFDLMELRLVPVPGPAALLPMVLPAVPINSRQNRRHSILSDWSQSPAVSMPHLRIARNHLRGRPLFSAIPRAVVSLSDQGMRRCLGRPWPA
jgi:hypothetical protein